MGHVVIQQVSLEFRMSSLLGNYINRGPQAKQTNKQTAQLQTARVGSQPSYSLVVSSGHTQLPFAGGKAFAQMRQPCPHQCGATRRS